MKLQASLSGLATRTRLAIGIVCDPTAAPGERWCATVGLSASGIGRTSDEAIGRACLDFDQTADERRAD